MEAMISPGFTPAAVIRVPIRRPAVTIAPSVVAQGRASDATVSGVSKTRAPPLQSSLR